MDVACSGYFEIISIHQEKIPTIPMTMTITNNSGETHLKNKMTMSLVFILFYFILLFTLFLFFTLILLFL